MDKFALKWLGGEFGDWFPRRETGRATRDQRVYLEENARCDRLKHSPIFFMRRRLNEIGGGDPGRGRGEPA